MNMNKDMLAQLAMLLRQQQGGGGVPPQGMVPQGMPGLTLNSAPVQAAPVQTAGNFYGAVPIRQGGFAGDQGQGVPYTDTINRSMTNMEQAKRLQQALKQLRLGK
jgi:hypothetical protein